jgi:hypothetical protein
MEPDVPTGLISIAKDDGLPLVEGSLNRNTPGILVGFLSQFLPSLRNCESIISFCHAYTIANVMKVILYLLFD